MVEQRLVLITLLVKLGVAAAVASALVRSVRFKSLLFRDERTLKENIQLVLFIGLPFALGIVVRSTVRNFLAADMSFESAILMGVIGGRFAGAMGGGFVALPTLIHGEWLTIPFNAFAGFIAGMLRDVATDREAVWLFSPFIDLSVYRWIRRNLQRPKIDWQILFLLTILLLRLARTELALAFPGLVFTVDSPRLSVEIAVYATSVIAIGIVMKIWNNARIEIKLEEQQRLVLQARMEALQNQINPHFLFNTLNSISSLVRFDPDRARDLIIKLASILRRLLRSSDAFVPLREELDFVDDYLDIEVVRFGPDKLHVIKDLDPASLEINVPGMLLQPLVENSIKHGLSSRIEGGSIRLSSQVRDGILYLEVADDGVGMGAAILLERPSGLGGTGIGMANVAERLKVLYGDAAKMTIDSHEGKGTSVRLRLPVIPGVEAAASLSYEARSTTQR